MKKGEKIVLDLYILQRDERIFPESNKFIMDRFCRDDGDKVSKVISWGVGPNFCIGAAFSMLSVKTTLTVLLREYELEAGKGQNFLIGTLPDTMPRCGFKVAKCRRVDLVSTTKVLQRGYYLE